MQTKADFEKDLCRLDIYFHFFWNAEETFDTDHVKLQIKKMASFYMTVFNPFAKLAAFLDADTFFDRFEYDRYMLKTKRQMELSARQQTPKVWADVCFTHCIFTKLFEHWSHWYYFQATYQKILPKQHMILS